MFKNGSNCPQPGKDLVRKNVFKFQKVDQIFKFYGISIFPIKFFLLCI